MRIIQAAIGETVVAIGHTISSNRDKRDPLLLPRFEPDRCARRYLKPKPKRLCAIKLQCAIRFKKMTMGPHLNRPVADIPHNQVHGLTPLESNDVALAENQFAGNHISRLEVIGMWSRI